MPLEGWYTITEVSSRTGVSYNITLRWIHQQEKATPHPTWLRRMSKGYLVRIEGLQLLTHAKGSKKS